MAGFKFQPLLFSGLTSSGGSSSITIGNPVGGSDPNSVLISDSSGNLADVPMSTGQLLIGRTGNTPVAATLTGTANQITVTSASGSITLALPQSIATTSSPTFANLNLSPSGLIDITSAGTLAIGTGNASIINIGNSGATINIQGNTFYQNVTDLNVADKNITVNHGGSAGSASNAGIQVEENSLITAYVDTTADRTGWEFKAPSTAGVVTITPGAGGFTLSQGSHNPVTLGTANGLSLSTQVLSLALSSTSTTGALSDTDWNTFNSKQTSGNYLTALTGDGAASGPGSAVLTLATVNSNVGSFGGATSVSAITVNAKGLVTAAASTSIQIAESQVTNLVSDLASKADKVTADIVPTTWSSLANNTANQTITGLTFATTVSSFEALINIFIDATTDTYTTIKLFGTRKDASDWSTNNVSIEYSGDAITGLDFNITSAGQVQISIGNITGFSSATTKFRAITV